MQLRCRKLKLRKSFLFSEVTYGKRTAKFQVNMMGVSSFTHSPTHFDHFGIIFYHYWTWRSSTIDPARINSHYLIVQKVEVYQIEFLRLLTLRSIWIVWTLLCLLVLSLGLYILGSSTLSSGRWKLMLTFISDTCVIENDVRHIISGSTFTPSATSITEVA